MQTWRNRTKTLLLGGLLAATSALSAQDRLPATAPRVDVAATAHGDSLTLCVTTYDIETQLTFLMQGLTLRVARADTLTLAFPSARMVRHKVRRHPNEVKAQLQGRDSTSQVVRPDVMPLLAALNDTTARLTLPDGTQTETRRFGISVARETGVMQFTFATARQLTGTAGDSLSVTLLSAPFANEARAEFRGQRLSQEHAPQPHGLGEGIRKEDIPNRTFNKTINLIINKKN